MNVNNRRQARYRLVQSLYQWSLTHDSIDTIRHQRIAEDEVIDLEYYQSLFAAIVNCVETLDEHLQTAIDRPLKDCDPVEHAILRIAVYELIHCPDIPAKVIINEAIELSKRLGAAGSYKMVNSALDHLRQKFERE